MDNASDPYPGDPDQRDDRVLLEAHVAGDASAFTTLVQRHHSRLWSLALRTTGHREEAADALQDALLSAFRNAAKFRGEAAVTTWLYRIVVNACVDRLRRAGARPTTPLPDYAAEILAQPGDAMADRDTALAVELALHQLPVAQRAALVLVDVEGYPVAEAAMMLGVAPGTIKSRCARGRAQLADALREHDLQDPPRAGNPRPAPDVKVVPTSEDQQ